MKHLFSTFIFSLFCNAAISQSMSFWADAMINSSSAGHRIFASDRFKDAFAEELKKEDSFTTQFKDLSWVSIQYPQDRSFRIISWQVDEGDHSYRYEGYFQNSQQLIPFYSVAGDAAIDEYEVVSIEHWSGALTYRIIQMDDTYLLWTFRYLDQYTKIKTCEPLIIEEGKVTLGSPIFQEEEGSPNYKYRHVLQYSADMNGILDFDEKSKRIVYDNLIMIAGRMQGQGMTYVADGSYRSFDFDNGRWLAKDKLFDQISERAPRMRASSKDKKDLFGRKGG